MVPNDLIELVSKQPGDTVRRDVDSAKINIESLGVSEDTQFAAFFLRFKVSTFNSKVSDEELLDIASPSSEIARATEFVHEVWELPQKFISFSSVEGEGCYLYNKEDGAVYDFYLGEREALINGEIKPRWPDFYSFMAWYLS